MCARVDSMSFSVCGRCLRTNALIKIFSNENLCFFMCNFSCRSVCRLTVWNHKFCRRLPRENRQRPKNTNTHTLTSKKKLFFQHSGAFAGFSVRMKARGGNRPRRYAEQQQKQQPLLDERRCQAMRAPINRTDRVHEKRKMGR